MKTALILLLSLACSLVQAQSGRWRYNPQGQLVDGKGQLANAHQEMHDMSNPSLYTTGAVAVSNTIDPNFAQANLATIEALMDPNAGQGGRAMSRLYLTPSNPYTPGAGVQSGAPVGFNSDHYDKILLDASSSGYKPTQSGAYMAKTHENSSASLFNRGFHTYEANAKFLAAKEAAGGQGGGIVFMINQSGESFAHLQAISGSNMFMSAYGRMQDGSVFRLGGQVVLNQKHNKSADLNTSMFGPAFVAGVHEANRRMASTGNEQGFWVTGTGGQTQIQDWGDGSAHSISAAYNPNARFHVHTHPNNTGPSHADMFASAVLGGMPGLVVAANGGQFAYGFQLEAGQIKRPDGGVLVFQECGATGMCGSDTRIYVTANHVGSSRLPFAHLEIQISSGYDFSVVEGQPEYSINPNLLYKSNGPNNGDAFSYQLTRPSDGRTLNQFARDILNAASRYENNHPYSLPNDVDFLAENEYNSNSFVSGVLSAANTNQVDFANIFHASYLNEKTIPGFENPVPISSAQNSNDDKKGPTEQEIKDHAGAIGNWGDGDVW